MQFQNYLPTIFHYYTFSAKNIKADLQQVLDKFMTYYEKKAFDKLRSLYTQDARLMDHGQRTINGRAGMIWLHILLVIIMS